jgi:hypothetical protein
MSLEGNKPKCAIKNARTHLESEGSTSLTVTGPFIRRAIVLSESFTTLDECGPTIRSYVPGRLLRKHVPTLQMSHSGRVAYNHGTGQHDPVATLFD